MADGQGKVLAGSSNTAGGAVGGAGRVGSVPGGASSRPVLSVAFNPRQRRLLATGDGSGTVRVWKLGWRFGSMQDEEQELLQSYVEASAAADSGAPDADADDADEASEAKSEADDGDNDGGRDDDGRGGRAPNSLESLMQRLWSN